MMNGNAVYRLPLTLFLFQASIILCLLSCMIFCVAPMEGDDEMMSGHQNYATNYHNMDNANAAGGSTMTPMPALDASYSTKKGILCT